MKPCSLGTAQDAALGTLLAAVLTCSGESPFHPPTALAHGNTALLYLLQVDTELSLFASFSFVFSLIDVATDPLQRALNKFTETTETISKFQNNECQYLEQ